MIADLPQPLGFFHVITGADALHYGYWPDAGCGADQAMTLAEAQQQHSRLIEQYIHGKQLQILDIGCGLGQMADELQQQGHQLTAIAPSASLIAYARLHHPGPQYIDCGFLDNNPTMQSRQYDVLLMQESLQYFPEIVPVLDKAAGLLKADGRMILCDEVSYERSTRERSAVHFQNDIEQAIADSRFEIIEHKQMGKQVTPTCEHVLRGIREKKPLMLDIFGSHHEAHIDHLYVEWQNLQKWYQQQIFGYELWVLGKKLSK